MCVCDCGCVCVCGQLFESFNFAVMTTQWQVFEVLCVLLRDTVLTVMPWSDSCPWTLNWLDAVIPRLVYRMTSLNCRQRPRDKISVQWHGFWKNTFSTPPKTGLNRGVSLSMWLDDLSTSFIQVLTLYQLQLHSNKDSLYFLTFLKISMYLLLLNNNDNINNKDDFY